MNTGECRITGPAVVGETGVEVEGGNEVLVEREEEDEAVVHSCSRRTKWMRAVVVPRKANWEFLVRIQGKYEILQQSQLCTVFIKL